MSKARVWVTILGNVTGDTDHDLSFAKHNMWGLVDVRLIRSGKKDSCIIPHPKANKIVQG